MLAYVAGIVSSDRSWQTYRSSVRKFLASCLSTDSTRKILALETQELMQELSHSIGQPFDATMLLIQFAANVISVIFCRKRWDYTNEDFREYVRNIVAGTEVTGVQGAMTAAGLQGILPKLGHKVHLLGGQKGRKEKEREASLDIEKQGNVLSSFYTANLISMQEHMETFQSMLRNEHLCPNAMMNYMYRSNTSPPPTHLCFKVPQIYEVFWLASRLTGDF